MLHQHTKRQRTWIPHQKRQNVIIFVKNVFFLSTVRIDSSSNSFTSAALFNVAKPLHSVPTFLWSGFNFLLYSDNDIQNKTCCDSFSLFFTSHSCVRCCYYPQLTVDLPVLLPNDSHLCKKYKFFTLQLQITSFHTSYNYATLKLILSNDVELNPGPNHSNPIMADVVNLSNFFVLSYNVRGCKNFNKLKRLSNFFHKLPFKNNCVINLQETHLNKTEKLALDYQWSYGSVQSCAVGNSGGVAILYDSSYFDQIISTKTDDNGRFCSLTVKKNDSTYCFINVYFPNENNEKVNFLEKLEEELWLTLDTNPNTTLLISGDFNLVLDAYLDSVNRNQSIKEKK